MEQPYTVKQLLEVLRYHHQQVKPKGSNKRGDEIGISIYTEMIAELSATGNFKAGRVNYLLERLLPDGKYPTYYAKIYTTEGRPEAAEIVDYFRHSPEQLVLATEGYGIHGYSQEIKTSLAGSVRAYHGYVMNLIGTPTANANSSPSDAKTSIYG